MVDLFEARIVRLDGEFGSLWGFELSQPHTLLSSQKKLLVLFGRSLALIHIGILITLGRRILPLPSSLLRG